ncbi:hypothetical protein vBVpaS1601_29 [Vibrio phage vB_VpaS_1601]|uniref:hypothetical protein n=1 Tax=Vibrio phage SHOU24 TaxID=1414739 RepID=UPI0003ED1FF0|nr:hypothetical protein SHOU24_57 [Vibrio phage SHOU24]AHI61254.1 hypothetical protein SHOU24_57 [Vibrio phage SHOU24]WHM52722.1 hypothetical protein vBVpaP1601_29 [Vibrio phage vB_VpaP_1601]
MRIQNWPRVIADQIKEHSNIPFEWGKKDCCLAVADIVNLYAGFDIAEDFRGKYKTLLGSKRALKTYGQGDIKSTIDTMMTEIPVEEAGRGDLALVKTEAGESLAILFSTRAWAMGENGMVALTMDKVICTWRVE